MGDPAGALPSMDVVLARVRAGEALEVIAGEVVPRELARVAHGLVQRRTGSVLDPFDRKPGGPDGPGGWWIVTEVDVLYGKTDELFRHDLVGFRRDRLPSRHGGHGDE